LVDKKEWGVSYGGAGKKIGRKWRFDSSQPKNERKDRSKRPEDQKKKFAG